MLQVIFALVFPLLVLWMQFYDDSTNSWKVPFWKKLKILYTAPIAKFWTHLVMKITQEEYHPTDSLIRTVLPLGW